MYINLYHIGQLKWRLQNLDTNYVSVIIIIFMNGKVYLL